MLAPTGKSESQGGYGSSDYISGTSRLVTVKKIPSPKMEIKVTNNVIFIVFPPKNIFVKTDHLQILPVLKSSKGLRSDPSLLSTTCYEGDILPQISKLIETQYSTTFFYVKGKGKSLEQTCRTRQ